MKSLLKAPMFRLQTSHDFILGNPESCWILVYLGILQECLWEFLDDPDSSAGWKSKTAILTIVSQKFSCQIVVHSPKTKNQHTHQQRNHDLANSKDSFTKVVFQHKQEHALTKWSFRMKWAATHWAGAWWFCLFLKNTVCISMLFSCLQSDRGLKGMLFDNIMNRLW